MERPDVAVPRVQPHPSYLAVDLGASSGRAVVGTLRDGVMHLEDVHRFRTPLQEEGAHLVWDAEGIWSEIQVALRRAMDAVPSLRSVSVDSWAVDYQPLTAAGHPVRKPYAYRDPRTQGRLPRVLERAGGADRVYARTGIQFLEFNTLPQVACDLEDEPPVVAATACRLLLADYFNYRLSGRAVIERSMASTTQVMDVTTGDWAWDLIDALGDSPGRWPLIVPSGTLLGALDVPRVGTSDTAAVQVIASCSHDTACAVAAVPASDAAPWAYLCAGTWSLIGAELSAPIVSDAARVAGFTNEAGLDGTVRFLKNRTGMWVLEELLRQWRERGEQVTHAELVAAASAAPPTPVVIDLDTPAFASRGDMEGTLAAACEAAGTDMPAMRGALVRLVYDSLAHGYARTLDELDALTGQPAHTLHVVGGPSQNALLNQLIADASGRRVVAGPVEATVLGNLAIQARVMGDLSPGDGPRDVARRSAAVTTFIPAVSPVRAVRTPAAH